MKGMRLSDPAGGVLEAGEGGGDPGGVALFFDFLKALDLTGREFGLYREDVLSASPADRRTC